MSPAKNFPTPDVMKDIDAEVRRTAHVLADIDAMFIRNDLWKERHDAKMEELRERINNPVHRW